MKYFKDSENYLQNLENWWETTIALVYVSSLALALPLMV